MRKKNSVWKGAVAGLAGGLAGTVAMTEFQIWWSKALEKSNGGQSSNVREPATVNATCAIIERVLDRPLNDREKDRAGQIVHYSFGALSGAVYGAMAEMSPLARRGAGLLFGGGLFVAVDELLVPLLGWSGAPQEYPVSSHLYGFASHAVYGVASDFARRFVRNRL